MENNATKYSFPNLPQIKGVGKLYIFTNKYFLTTLFFILWMIFFDPKDWGIAYHKNSKLKEFQKTELHLVKTINETKEELKQLKSNVQTIEKYARENYFMKKDNEDLFIFSVPTNK